MNGTTPNPTYDEVCCGEDRPRRGGAGRLRPGRRSPTPTCSRSSSRSTTRPRGCARATTSAPSTARASTSPTTPRRRRRRWRAEAYDETLRAAGHEPITTEVEPAGALLLRRGLPPAVPAQGPQRLLRARRHRRLLPHPGRRGLSRRGAPRARRIASRARGPLLRFLHRRLPRRDRHRRGGRPRRLLAAALDRARILRRAGAARRRHHRGRAAGPLARDARHAQHPAAGLDHRRLDRDRAAGGAARLAEGAGGAAQEVPAPKVQTIALRDRDRRSPPSRWPSGRSRPSSASTRACSAATPPGTTCPSRRRSPRNTRRSTSTSPTRCGWPPGSTRRARS